MWAFERIRLPSITTPLPVTWLAACLVQGFQTSGSRFVEKTLTTEFSTTPWLWFGDRTRD